MKESSKVYVDRQHKTLEDLPQRKKKIKRIARPFREAQKSILNYLHLFFEMLNFVFQYSKLGYPIWDNVKLVREIIHNKLFFYNRF